MRLAIGFAVAVVAGALAAPAAAQTTRTVQAVNTATENYWTPSTLAAKPGDSVEWRLTQEGNPTNHDVFLIAPGSETATRVGASFEAPVFTRVVDQIGTYRFYCSIHGGLAEGGMNGSIAVSTEEAPPPPPPVDPGPAAAPNPTIAPTVFEEGDTVRPTMTLGRVTSSRASARVRVTASEAGTLYLRVLRGKRAVTTRQVKVAAGVASATVKLPRRAGHYRLAIFLRDAAGLESRWRYQSLRVR